MDQVLMLARQMRPALLAGDWKRAFAHAREAENILLRLRLALVEPAAVRGEKDKSDRRYGPEKRKLLTRERAEPKRDAVQAFARNSSARGLSRSRIIELGAKKLGLQKTVFEEFAGEALPPSQKKKTPGI